MDKMAPVHRDIQCEVGTPMAQEQTQLRGMPPGGGYKEGGSFVLKPLNWLEQQHAAGEMQMVQRGFPSADVYDYHDNDIILESLSIEQPGLPVAEHAQGAGVPAYEVYKLGSNQILTSVPKGAFGSGAYASPGVGSPGG